MVEERVDFPYADVAPGCSYYCGNDRLEADSGMANAGSGYSVAGVNRNLARVTLEVGYYQQQVA